MQRDLLKRFDEAPLYKSGRDCFQQGIKTEGQDFTYKVFFETAEFHSGRLAIVNPHEGWSLCWKGLGPTLIRAFPANAALFFTYQFVSDYLYRLQRNQIQYKTRHATQ